MASEASLSIPAVTVTGSELAERHALVTGGSRGIGLAIARALAGRGARVTIVSRAATRAVHVDGLTCIDADISEEAQLVRAFAQARSLHGPIEVLVNNAGIAESAPLSRTTTELWDRIIATNLTATFLGMREVVGEMRAAHFGRIVNVASIAGLGGAPYLAAYCAGKHGVVGLTRAAAAELADSGVTVNAVCPGYTRTEMMAQAVANIVRLTQVDARQAEQQLAATNPQGRLASVDEVAGAVLALCDGDQTGQCVVIPGGTLA
ncbi:MAG: SDR family NAD(P)-dependent oxidoreductase [Vulcanimicrobiaceae bacterium]